MELCKNTNPCSQRRDLHPASSFCFWLADSVGWLAGWLLGLAGRQPSDLAGWLDGFTWLAGAGWRASLGKATQVRSSTPVSPR